MSDIPSRETDVSERKRLDLREKGMQPIGWIFIEPETGKRATLDYWGRLQWWDVDGSGTMVSARVAELEAMRFYWTCDAGGETFTTYEQSVADEWSGDGLDVTRHFASDESTERIAELEAENDRLRSILTELAGAEANDRMGLYVGSEE